jgi:Ion channel
MITTYHSYSVKIFDRKFYSEDGKEYNRTAVVSFLDEKERVITIEEFGYLETDKIYDLIDLKETINLDNCYVKNFSLSAYRRLRILEKQEYVDLKGFSAKNAFFDSTHIIDFSYANFGDNELNFSYSYFVKGGLNFAFSKIGSGNVDFSYTVMYIEYFDFSNTVFTDGDIIFKNTKIIAPVIDFQYADLGVGAKNFVNAEFGKGDVSFINTNFNEGRVSFKVARFESGKIDFHFAKFGKGDISFEQTEFGDGKVDFRTVEFGKGKVNFNRAVFGDGEISFEASQLHDGKISFKRTVFGNGGLNYELAEYEGSEMIFDRAEFGSGNVSFSNSRIKQLSLKSCHLNNYFDLRVYKCDLVDLSDTIVRDIIDFKPYDFDVDIKIIDFSGMRLLGTIYIDWKANKVQKMIERQPKANHRSKADQYRILKENFNFSGQYSDEDKSYVEFKRHEMKANLYDEIEEKKWKAIFEYPWYLAKYLIFDKAGKYATDPVRVMVSMLAGYTFFSLLFLLVFTIDPGTIVSGIGEPPHSTLDAIPRSFYHSAITFLTIGYGDFYPTGIMRWLSAVEGFVGLFLMSYFTVAFVRKILR